MMLIQADMKRLEADNEAGAAFDLLIENGFLEPAATTPMFQLVIMRGSKVVKRWPMRNETRAKKGKVDWEKDRDERSVFYKGCHAVIERREVTAWSH